MITEELVEEIIKMSWEHSDFKNQLIENPRTVLKDKFDIELVDKLNKIIVNDQTDPNIVYFNIKPKPNIESLTLTDEQLDQVAGGEIAGTIGLCCVAFSLGWGIAEGIHCALTEE